MFDRKYFEDKKIISHEVLTEVDWARKFDLVITSRMHAGIMAMSAGVPAIIVLPRMEQKSIEVLNYLELEEMHHFEDMLRLSWLPEKVEYAVENLSEMRKTVDSAVEKKLDDVIKPVEWIKEVVE